MSILRANQTATYWYPTGGGSWGEPTWSDPQILSVRWQDKQQLIRDKEGREVVSEAVVYTHIPIVQEGRLQKGAHTGTPDDAREVKAVSEHVTIDGESDHWKVYL